MTGFRFPAASDAADLQLLPADGTLAAIVHEYLGVLGNYDAKWGEFDNSQPTYRAKLVLRSLQATRLAVAYGGKRRANVAECKPGQVYVLDLDAYVNDDDGKIRILFDGTVHEISIHDLWASEEGKPQVTTLLAD